MNDQTDYLPTVQPSSVQKNEKKEDQYQMERGPLNSATHTQKENNINNEQNKKQKKQTNHKSKQNRNKHTNKQTKLG